MGMKLANQTCLVMFMLVEVGLGCVTNTPDDSVDELKGVASSVLGLSAHQMGMLMVSRARE